MVLSHGSRVALHDAGPTEVVYCALRKAKCHSHPIAQHTMHGVEMILRRIMVVSISVSAPPK